MIRKSKKHLIGPDGKPVKAITLYKFFYDLRALDGTPSDGDLVDAELEGHMLGNYTDMAVALAEQRARIEQQFPLKKVVMRAEAMEVVGPLIQQQITGYMTEYHVQNLVAFELARQLAQYKAKESLSLTPDIEAITQRIVVETRMFIRQKLVDFRAQQDAVQSSGLTTVNGAPLTNDSASGVAQAKECTGTGEPCCGAADCSDACGASEGEDAAFDGEQAQPGDILDADEVPAGVLTENNGLHLVSAEL